MSVAARRFIISGRVQGVYFRASTRKEAERLGLRGSAVNLPDGRVEVLVTGSETAMDELGRWLQTGPSLARVTEVQVDVVPATDFSADFRCS
jgi:acylphosphatase